MSIILNIISWQKQLKKHIYSLDTAGVIWHKSVCLLLNGGVYEENYIARIAGNVVRRVHIV
jgi:hypothetical protein